MEAPGRQLATLRGSVRKAQTASAGAATTNFFSMRRVMGRRSRGRCLRSVSHTGEAVRGAGGCGGPEAGARRSVGRFAPGDGRGVGAQGGGSVGMGASGWPGGGASG